MWGIKNVLLNGQLPGSIVFHKTTIYDTYTGGQIPPHCEMWIDGQGRLEAYPAFIENHGHDRYDEPHLEDPGSLVASAHAGGVGTLILMPNGKTQPFKHPDMLEELELRWEGKLITVRYNIAIGHDNMDVIARLGECRHPMIGNVKEYDASTNNPTTLLDTLTAQYKGAEAIGKSGKVKVNHAEFEEWLKRNRHLIEQERKLQIDDHCRIRDGAVEVKGIENSIQVCRDTRVPTHICHVSTKRGIELIMDAVAEGLPITFETCPQYWCLNEGHLRTLRGRSKMNPAVRTEDEMLAIGDYICRPGVPVIIASDHAPHHKTGEETDYDSTPSGVPGVQTFGLLAYQPKVQGKISGTEFKKRTSTRAAQLNSLNKGELHSGYDGDVVLIDPIQTTAFTHASMKYKCRWTPYDGTTVQGKIMLLAVAGSIVRNELEAS